MVVWRNTLEQWAIAGGVTVGLLFAMLLLKKVVIARLKRRPESKVFPWEDLAVALAKDTRKFALFCFAVTLGAQTLDLPPRLSVGLDRAGFLVLVFQLFIWGNVAIAFLVETSIERSGNDGARTTSVRAIGFLVRLVFFSVVLLWCLDNFGINITTLVAGLGVGGIAVALAVQNILGDLFASLTIVLDKPFVIGDAITVDTFSGTIEHVGLKTTRVRSTDGEQLIFPNANLLQSRIRNYKRMQERRALVTFTVAYGTPADKVEALPREIRSVIEAQPRVRFDRANLKQFGTAGLDFEAVYWILSPEYNVFAETHERITLGIYRHLADREIDFAAAPKTHFVTLRDQRKT